MKLRFLLIVFGALHWTVGAASAQKAADTLRWATNAPMTTADPYSSAYREQMIFNGQLIWDTLIFRNPETGEYVPLLAKSWKWVDDVTLEFELRDDVKWHDDQPLRVEDAVYTFNWISNPANKVAIQSNVNWIANAEKTGEHTFRLNLKKPFPAAFEYLSILLPVLPEGFFAADGTAGANGRLVGTGPYRIAGFTPGVGIELELTGKYFADSPKGQPTIGKINYRPVPDPSTQLAELLSGGLDWIWYVPADQAPRVAEVPGLATLASGTMRIMFLSYNTREMEGGNPLTDIRVRKAIAHAVDRKGIVDNVIGAGASVLTTPCYHTQFGCKQASVDYEYDLDKAKALLAEAGYADGITIDIVVMRQRVWAEAIVGSLAKAGIKANIVYLEYAAAREVLANNKAHIWLGGWGSYSINDVSALFDNFFTFTSDDMVRDQELSDLLKQASQITDVDARKKMYDTAVDRIAENAYWTPLWDTPIIYGSSSDLEFKAYPDENPRFFNYKWR